jgi:hypothetical protein
VYDHGAASCVASAVRRAAQLLSVTGGSPVLGFSDDNGQPRFRIVMYPDGSPAVSLLDKSANLVRSLGWPMGKAVGRHPEHSLDPIRVSRRLPSVTLHKAVLPFHVLVYTQATSLDRPLWIARAVETGQVTHAPTVERAVLCLQETLALAFRAAAHHGLTPMDWYCQQIPDGERYRSAFGAAWRAGTPLRHAVPESSGAGYILDRRVVRWASCPSRGVRALDSEAVMRRLRAQGAQREEDFCDGGCAAWVRIVGLKTYLAAWRAEWEYDLLLEDEVWAVARALRIEPGPILRPSARTE